MDYKNKYDASLELAADYRNAYLEQSKTEEVEVLEEIFPELKESEETLMTLDEAIKYCKEKSCENTACGKNHKQLAEWLTELKSYRDSTTQKVQKPVNKVYKPKLREGDIIMHQGTKNVYQVIAIVGDYYQLKYGDTYTAQKCIEVDKCSSLIKRN